MDIELFDKCIDLVRNYDNKWIKRHRKIDTEVIFKSLISSAVTDIGVSSCLKGFESNFSHAALNKARKKLDKNCFKTYPCGCTQSNIINISI